MNRKAVQLRFTANTLLWISLFMTYIMSVATVCMYSPVISQFLYSGYGFWFGFRFANIGFISWILVVAIIIVDAILSWRFKWDWVPFGIRFIGRLLFMTVLGVALSALFAIFSANQVAVAALSVSLMFVLLSALSYLRQERTIGKASILLSIAVVVGIYIGYDYIFKLPINFIGMLIIVILALIFAALSAMIIKAFGSKATVNNYQELAFKSASTITTYVVMLILELLRNNDD